MSKKTGKIARTIISLALTAGCFGGRELIGVVKIVDQYSGLRNAGLSTDALDWKGVFASASTFAGMIGDMQSLWVWMPWLLSVGTLIFLLWFVWSVASLMINPNPDEKKYMRRVSGKSHPTAIEASEEVQPRTVPGQSEYRKPNMDEKSDIRFAVTPVKEASPADDSPGKNSNGPRHARHARKG